jgi:hypothetical protein
MMIRKFSLAIAALAVVALSGCVTSGYGYRGGSGDYYYGRSSSSYGYGAPYGSVGYGYPGGWYGGLGYGYSTYGYYPYYPYAYYGSGYGYRGPYHAPYRPRALRIPQRDGGYGAPLSAAQAADLRRQIDDLRARNKGLPQPGVPFQQVPQEASRALAVPMPPQQGQPVRISPRDRSESGLHMQQRISQPGARQRVGSRKPGVELSQRP